MLLVAIVLKPETMGCYSSKSKFADGANAVCRAGRLIQSSFEHVGSMKKSVREACRKMIRLLGPMLTRELKSPRHSLTSPVCKDKNFSITRKGSLS